MLRLCQADLYRVGMADPMANREGLISPRGQALELLQIIQDIVEEISWRYEAGIPGRRERNGKIRIQTLWNQ